MAKTYHSLSTANFSQDWSDTGLISANNDWSIVPSIVGYLGDNPATTAAPIDPRTFPDNATVNVIANQSNPNTLSSGGVAEFQIANPTIALQGSGTADAPNIVIYLNAAGRQNVTISYRVRDIDGSTDNAVQPVALQYRTSATGAWINVDSAFIADATTGPSLATLETLVTATLPADANSAPNLEVRIITGNASGNDEWVGIDNIVVTSDPQPPMPGSFSISDVTLAEGNSGATDFTFTVNRSGGVGGTVTVDFAVQAPGGDGRADPADVVGGTLPTGTVTFLDGETSKTITVQVQGDASPESNETFSVLLSNPTGGATITDGEGVGTINNDDVVTVTIMQIQGESHSSPLAGQLVRTSGVVTAVDSNGFYLQDVNGDGNNRTSDAIFIFTSTAPTVTVGQTADVSGTVTEFRPGNDPDNLTTTQLNNVTVTATGTAAVPTPVLIGAGGRLPPSDVIEDDGFTSFQPETDGLDFYESLEGMLVTIEAPLVVSETNGFDETFVVASGGVGATGVNSRGGITVSEGDFNPEKLEIQRDSTLSPGYDPNHTQGDRLANVTGVMSYSFENYEVLVIGNVTVTSDVTVSRETTTNVGTADRLSIASMNVENLDPTDPQSKFDLLAGQIFTNLAAPDIIAVQEIQDADGAGAGTSYSGQPTAQKLIDTIAALGGPTYVYAEIAPTANNQNGGESNGNIRNGYFYNPQRVSLVAGSLELIQNPAFNGSRKPLVATFEFNGQLVTTINVHSTSRIGSQPLTGVNQPPTNAGDTARLNQSTAVRDYINNELATDPALKFTVLGDFNAFYFEPALQVLENNLTNLHFKLPEEERYTFLFDGNLQPLDNILVSDSLFGSAQYDIVHVNAEQTSTTARPTDHDPSVATLLLANVVPVANDDALAASEDTPVTYTAAQILGNDTDTAGATLRIASVSNAVNGTVVLNADGSVTFTPTAEFSGTATFDYVVDDGDGGTDTGRVTVTVGAVDDAAVARDDRVATDEATAVSGNLFADNGGGADSDVDGPALQVAEVNGQAANVGQQIRLASGALLTVNADGTFSYNPSGAFNDLVGAQGAANSQATDSFTYRLANGNVATATVTISGITQPREPTRGTAGNDTIIGTNEAELILVGQGGDDNINAGGGNDGILFSGALTTADQVNGGEGTDVLALQGNYAGGLVLGAGNLVSIETFSVLPGSDQRFGDTANNSYSYALTTVDANVAAGQRLKVIGAELRAGENFTFNGSAETDGSFLIYAGRGVDTFTGGSLADGFFFANGRFNPGDRVDGGGGVDVVVFRGDYDNGNAITLAADTLTSIETITLMSASDTRFFAGGARYSYDLTTNDGNVGVGQTLSVIGAQLTAEETMRFNGAAETDGAFRIFGGAADDVLTGGAGNDLIMGRLGADRLTGGLGADTFRYDAARESTSLDFDQLVGFDSATDRIDLPGDAPAFSDMVSTGRLNSATFDQDLAAALNAVLGAGEAALFTPNSGDFAGRTFGIVDANGVAGYQAGEDFVLEFVSPMVPPAIGVDIFI